MIGELFYKIFLLFLSCIKRALIAILINRIIDIHKNSIGAPLFGFPHDD